VIAVLHVTIVKRLKACLYVNKSTFSRSQNLIPDELLLSGQFPIPRGWLLNRGSTVCIKLFLLEHTGRQTQGNGGPHPPKRPDYGTVGRPIRLRANFFRLNISSQLSDLYHYDVEIKPKNYDVEIKPKNYDVEIKRKCPRSVKRDVVNEIIKRYKDTAFQGHHPAFDGEKNLYSRIKLPPVSVYLAE